MTDDYVYQLVRIGPTATCNKVPDVMRLELGLTRIGRGQHNDFYLDSLVLKNFISRSHVEIFGKKNENGETHKTCILELGDKITFGHTNGYKIQPGSYAEQPTSEFQFEFLRTPKSSKTSEMFSESMSSPNAQCEDSLDSAPDLKKEQTDRLFLSDIPNNTQSSENSSKSKQSQSQTHKSSSRARRDSSSQSENELNTSRNSSYSKSSHSKGSGKRNSDSTSRSPQREATHNKKRKTSAGSLKLSETVPAQESDEVDSEKSGKSSSDMSDSEEEMEKRRKPKKKVAKHEESKPEADQRPKPPPMAKLKPGKKKRIGNDAPAIGGRKKKRKGDKNDVPAIGGRKKKRRGGMASSTPALPDPPAPSADLEPGVEWYEDDKCDAADCKRPKKKKTS
ncbi:hypothetical protein MAR_005734, partial [Mya arenaria]